MSDWDAARYDRVSDPQAEWGRRVIARLAPHPHERMLDLGCGTGRVTAELATRVADGLVVGLDRSEAMLTVARAAPGHLRFVRGDGAALPFGPSFDGVFSAATLHWIADHEAVFRGVYATLRPGGRFSAQCGGGPNLERLYTRAARLMQTSPYAAHASGWRDPWYFALPEPTAALLRRAGFVDVRVGLESAPVTFDSAAAFAEFIACVCVRHHLQRLPPNLHDGFVGALAAAAQSDEPPFTLDYWRLNIDARKPVA